MVLNRGSVGAPKPADRPDHAPLASIEVRVAARDHWRAGSVARLQIRVVRPPQRHVAFRRIAPRRLVHCSGHCSACSSPNTVHREQLGSWTYCLHGNPRPPQQVYAETRVDLILCVTTYNMPADQAMHTQRGREGQAPLCRCRSVERGFPRKPFEGRVGKKTFSRLFQLSSRDTPGRTPAATGCWTAVVLTADWTLELDAGLGAPGPGGLLADWTLD